MANSDGQVRIIIDTNANEAVKALNDTSKAFDNSAKKAREAATVYGQFEQENTHLVEQLREIALAGGQNGNEFKRLAGLYRENKKALEEADNAVQKATGGLRNQQSGMSSLMRAARGLIGGYVGIQGAIKAFNFSMESVDAFRVQERAVASLNTTLKNAGVYSAEYSAKIQELASSIQSYSNYGDEAIIKAQALGQSFAGQVPFTENATKAVVDFAAATGMDLEQAFTLFGKSIGSSINALSRYGVELQKGMTESQKMEAIAKQLGDRYKGQAAQMADASIQLKNAIGDLSEAIGENLNPTISRIQKNLKALAEQMTENIKITRLLKTENADLGTMQNAINKRIALEGELYKIEQKFARGGTTTDYYNRRKGEIEQEIKLTQQWAIAYAQRQKREEEANKKRKSVKFNDDFGTASTGGGNAVSSPAKMAKEVKNAFEQAQAEAQKAEKAFKLALYQSGGNVTPAVEQARLKMVDTKKAVEDVQKAFERLTATAKTPFEQLNFNIEQSRQKIISLASQPVVDLEAIRQAQTEYQGFLTQQEQINSYLQPVKGAYQELNDKITELTLNLKNLSAQHKVGTAEWVNYKTQLQEAKAELNKVNQSLTDNGVKLEDYGKQISSSLSSGIVNALRNGGNAFEAFSSLATTALQKILDKLIEMSFVTPILNALTGGVGSSLFSFFGFNAGAAFNNGNVIPFAKGGVVNQPTIFPMANGGTGLMGEAGAEAVMPLRRMSNGRLGVEAENENGKAVQVNIYNQSGANVETRKRDDGSMDIFIRKVNEALSSERTASGFRSAYAREDRKGVQAV